MFIPSIHTMPFDGCSGHPEQRRGVQGGVAGTVMDMKFFRKLVQWIREEFEATPDLRLTTREAAAFLGLDLTTAERVLSQLFRSGVLRRYADDRYGVIASA
jgi:hypothetical protein